LKRILTAHREALARVLVCLARALLSALLAGAQVFGGYAPFAVGSVGAAGPGWEGLGALVGAGLGALALLDFPHALRTMACSVLLFTANNAFCELAVYRRRWFLPALTAALMLAVEAIYVLRAGSAAEAALCLTAILLAAVFAVCCRLVYETPEPRRAQPLASLVVLTGVLTAISAPELPNGFAPGRIASVLAVLLLAFDRELAAASASALCIGLAMDLAAPDRMYLHAACYGLGALLTALTHRGSRVRAAAAFALGSAAFCLPLGARTGVPLAYECLAGTLVFLLIPNQALRSVHMQNSAAVAAADSGLRARLRETAEGLRELYDSVARAKPAPEENPAVIFDRAAEAVCRDCPLRGVCWEREYNSTYTALNDATAAMLQNARGRGEDFPSYFSARCIRFPSFLGAVNAELHAYLLRRRYRAQLEQAYARSAGQYAQLSELLAQTAERPAAAAASSALLPYRVGVATRPRNGEAVSGDSVSTFETPAGELCLLLSDGMGSGEGARRESALAVRLTERFLRAGVDARPALRTLNSALNLRAERSDSFTTVDLLTLSLRSGEGELYKYGAAPSYIKRGERVRRVCCSTLPAGLAEETQPPEATHVRLEGGSYFIMLTDGVADDTDDAWLQKLLAAWEGDDPQQLVSAILADSFEHRGTGDDALALALYLPDGTQTPREV